MYISRNFPFDIFHITHLFRAFIPAPFIQIHFAAFVTVKLFVILQKNV